MAQTFEAVNKPEANSVRSALQRLGIERPGSGTLAVAARVVTDVPIAAIWQIWSDLERWPAWSHPLHQSTRWLEKRTWEVGAKFEQIRNLGFPFGRALSIETVREVMPERCVSWWKSEHGVGSCHIWFFDTLPDGRTAITNTEVITGPTIALAKPMCRTRWNALFDLAVHNLTVLARKL